jgi:hypothetical protein
MHELRRPNQDRTQLRENAVNATAKRGIPFPGGQIDADRLTEGEIYIGTPQPAVAPPGCEAADTYTTLLRERRFDEIPLMFTPDAVLFLAGQPVFGETSIAEFYRTRVSRKDPQPIVVCYVPLSGSCLAQIATSRVLAGGEREYFVSSWSQFMLAPDGRVKMMLAYGRRNPIVSDAVKNMTGN